MKAWVVRRCGGPEVLEWAELPQPVPHKGEIVVCVITHKQRRQALVKGFGLTSAFGIMGRDGGLLQEWPPAGLRHETLPPPARNPLKRWDFQAHGSLRQAT